MAPTVVLRRANVQAAAGEPDRVVARRERWRDGHRNGAVDAVVSKALLHLDRQPLEAGLHLSFRDVELGEPEASLVQPILDGDRTDGRVHGAEHAADP